jgi:hypothetical protein
MKNSIKKFFKKIFNSNTGYFIESITYVYNDRIEIGYVLYRGYIMFGISGHTRINVYVNKIDAESDMKKLSETK